MINGTAELDAALESLNEVLKVVREEKWSVDYTRAHAPLAGSVISEQMSIQEAVEFHKSVQECTMESKENIKKALAIIGEVSEIIEHYSDLVEIGIVWHAVAEKTIDNLRCYQ
jgi:hypothetical protein